MDKLAHQLADLTLIMKKESEEQAPIGYGAGRGRHTTRTCSFCEQPEHGATGCEKNPNMNTLSRSCDKYRHSDSNCSSGRGNRSNQRTQTGNAVSSQEICEGNQERARLVSEVLADFVATTKRLAIEEPGQKERKVNDDTNITRVLNPALPSQHITAKGVKSQIRMKSRNTKTEPGKSVARYFQNHIMRYDVIQELANALTGLSFGQLWSGDAKETRKCYGSYWVPDAFIEN